MRTNSLAGGCWGQIRLKWPREVRAGFRFSSHEWMPAGKPEHLFRLGRLLYRYEDRWRKTTNRATDRIDADPEPNTGYRGLLLASRRAASILPFIPRGRLDHRQDASTDRLGQFGPGGHDGGAHSPRSLNSSISSTASCAGKLASIISTNRRLTPSASRSQTPMMKARSGSLT